MDAAALCALAATLNRVVAAESDYAVGAGCPDIGFGALPATGTIRSQAGAYYPETGQIELAPDLDLSDAVGQSYLLHELVHAAQFAAGADAKAACPAALEAEAYTVQARYLRAHGNPREAVMLTVLADQLGSCHMDEAAQY
jgi:hypothetical protein